MTATVTLTAVWLNLAADTSDYTSFQNVTQFELVTAHAGQTQVMASGRLRAITGLAQPREYRLTLPQCTRTQIDWLLANVGSLVCVRDDRGRKIYATYLAVPLSEWTVSTAYADVNGLVVTETTHSEAV